MRRLSGWPATGVGLVSVTLDMEQPSVAQVQEACNVALAPGVRADSLSLAQKNSQLRWQARSARACGTPLMSPADDVAVTRPVAPCTTDPQSSRAGRAQGRTASRVPGCKPIQPTTCFKKC